MDRRRFSMAAAAAASASAAGASSSSNGGFSRRRHRSTPLRDSPPVEDGQMEVKETARPRDPAVKRERERDSVNRNKRRRGGGGGGDGVAQGNSRDDGEETTEESVDGEDGEDEYEIGEGSGLTRTPLPHPNSTSSSSSLAAPATLNHQRKSLPPLTRVSKQVQPLKVADEMIGVPVPRKARSACVKRSHESWISGNGGFGEDLNQRRASTSPASRSGGEAASPPSSNVSVRKKMKFGGGPKTRLPKMSSKSCSTAVQEDIEIEIAEVLYGLMKQSQGGKKEDNAEDERHNFESKDRNGSVHDSNSSPTSILTQTDGPSSDPISGLVFKQQKVDADSTVIQNGSAICTVRNESVQPEKMQAPSPQRGSVSGLQELPEEVSKEGDSKMAIQDSQVGSKEKYVSPKEESTSCSTKLDVDVLDSTATIAASTASEKESQREEKFKIDLMAPPPMTSSPERDGFMDLSTDTKSTVQGVEMVEIVVKNEQEGKLVKEAIGPKVEEKASKTVRERQNPKMDVERLSHTSGNESGTKLQQKQPPKGPIAETTAQPSAMPLSIAIAGWPGGIPPVGCMPPFQTIMPMDGTTGSSKALQPPRFPLSQPRPKRCATHHFIASNIHLHQQFMKMNQFWPGAASPAALCGAKPNNLNTMPSAESMIIGSPLQGNFPVVHLNSAKDKGQAVPNFPIPTGKDRISEEVCGADAVQKKQHITYQSRQPAPAGNLLHGPALIFSLGQHQAPVAAASNQTGNSKSTASVNNASLSGNAVAGVAANSSALPAVAAAVSFNYPRLAGNETPYLTILPNHAYPFTMSAAVENQPSFRGGNPAQALPFYNGSFYPSPMFHPSQIQQQQRLSQHPLQQMYQNASTSSGSSSSHKQPPAQQPRGGQNSGNNFLTSTTLQPLQPQKQHPASHQARKLETEKSGDSTPVIADSRASHNQRSVQSQNFTVPLQANFGSVTPTTVGAGSSGNHVEKQRLQQSLGKSIKGGLDHTQPQGFAMSFASLNGNNTTSNLSFSSMQQNPAVLQSLPAMARQGYQVLSGPQTVQKKNQQPSEGKTSGSSINPDDGKKSSQGKSATSGGQTLVFDNSPGTFSFMSSPFAGSWPSRSITSTTNGSFAANSPNTQQQQLLQLQNQQILHPQLQQQQQQQLQHHAGVAHSKLPATNNLPSSSFSTKFSHNAPIFCQASVQNHSSAQSSQWKNSPKAPASQGPRVPLVASNSSTLKNVSQQQGKAAVGHSQISFGGNSKSALHPLQGQQTPSSNQSSLLVPVSSTAGGNLRSGSTSTKGNSSVPTSQSQQSDNSSAGNAQKSSPVCGRNVPSILNTCPSHLSELKY